MNDRVTPSAAAMRQANEWARWQGFPEPYPGALAVEYRVSLDGQTWSPWARLGAELVFSPMYLPRWFQFRPAGPAAGERPPQ